MVSPLFSADPPSFCKPSGVICTPADCSRALQVLNGMELLLKSKCDKLCDTGVSARSCAKTSPPLFRKRQWCKISSFWGVTVVLATNSNSNNIINDNHNDNNNNNNNNNNNDNNEEYKNNNNKN